jgi:protein-L-isoaspartate(D-aspartate) O-methyltransferase
MAPGGSHRRQLVHELAISDPRVRDAFLAVPRELFVPSFHAEHGLAAVYRDDVIVTKTDEHGRAISSSSQPRVMAAMLERLELEPGQRVLEIGAGTGYNAALLKTIVGPRGRVVSVDVDPEVAHGARAALRRGGCAVRVVVGDGRDGFAAAAPYDRIVATASTGEVPRAWLDQLREGGLLELPLRLSAGGLQAVATFRRRGEGLDSVAVVPGGFMPLRGPGIDPPQLHVLSASEVPGGPIVGLSGEALRSLSPAARRRLLALVLGEPRRTPLGRLPLWPLGFHLPLALPASRLLMRMQPPAIGVAGRGGRSLALVEGGLERGDEPQPLRLAAYGDGEAEEFLRGAIERWQERGRPAEAELRLTIRFDGGRSRISRRWAR